LPVGRYRQLGEIRRIEEPPFRFPGADGATPGRLPRWYMQRMPKEYEGPRSSIRYPRTETSTATKDWTVNIDTSGCPSLYSFCPHLIDDLGNGRL
jgi:hypothetical protein